MSRRAVSLPIRSLSSGSTLSINTLWICRRCMATQPPSTSNSPPQTYDPTLPFAQRIGPDGQPYSLTKTDRLLKKVLKQRIPVQYLQHSTSEILPEGEKEQREQTVQHKKVVGVVVSSGKMDKTVTVRVGGQTWNKRIGKMFHSAEQHLVHDPNNSLITGDVVELHRLHVSRRVRHVVASVISPFGKPLDARPPIPTPDDRLAAYKEARFRKLRRRELRGKAAKGDVEAIQALKDMGLDSVVVAEPVIGKTNSEKGAKLGQTGQKLPSNILADKTHEVGINNDRATLTKTRAVEGDDLAADNLPEADEKRGSVEDKNVGTDSVLK